MESILDREPVDTTPSQTCSNGFFNDNVDQYSSTKSNQKRVSLKVGRYKDVSKTKGNWIDTGKNSNYFNGVLNKNSQMQFDTNVRQQNSSSGL